MVVVRVAVHCVLMVVLVVLGVDGAALKDGQEPATDYEGWQSRVLRQQGDHLLQWACAPGLNHRVLGDARLLCTLPSPGSCPTSLPPQLLCEPLRFPAPPRNPSAANQPTLSFYI